MKKTRNELYYQMPYVNQTTLEKLSDEEAGVILKALNRHTQGEREPMPTLAAEIFYHQYCDHIDEEHIRWDEERSRKSAGGKNKKHKENKSSDDSLTEDKTLEDSSTEDKILEDTSRYLKIVEDTCIKQNKTKQIQNKTNQNETNQTTIGGGNTAAAYVENLMNDARWMNDTSQLVMMPIEAMRDEMQKFAMQLRATKDTTDDERKVIKDLLAWLRKGRRMNEIEKAKQDGNSIHKAADLLDELREQYARESAAAQE